MTITIFVKSESEIRETLQDLSLLHPAIVFIKSDLSKIAETSLGSQELATYIHNSITRFLNDYGYSGSPNWPEILLNNYYSVFIAAVTPEEQIDEVLRAWNELSNPHLHFD